MFTRLAELNRTTIVAVDTKDLDAVMLILGHVLKSPTLLQNSLSTGSTAPKKDKKNKPEKPGKREGEKSDETPSDPSTNGVRKIKAKGKSPRKAKSAPEIDRRRDPDMQCRFTNRRGARCEERSRGPRFKFLCATHADR